MRFGSVFTGIGGADLGLVRAGMAPVWQIEKDEFVRLVLEKHWPHVRRFGDVRDVKPEELDPVELVWGSPPCQPFSVAGRRDGTDDPRHLWPEMARIVRGLPRRPAWVVVENVAGMWREYADLVAADLEDMGYEVRSLLLPAFAVGAPHYRERLFVIACLSDAYGHGRERKAVSAQQRQEILQPGWVCESVPNASGVGCHRGVLEEAPHWGRKEVAGEVSGATEPGICGGPDGFPSWLDGCLSRLNVWPPGWDSSIPKTVPAFSVPNRRKRVRALGEAVVPQVAQLIGMLIMHTHRAFQKRHDS